MAFKAFISYKHNVVSDFVKRFEYALKQYGKPVLSAPIRIFRDENHLRPGVNLPQLIRSALEDSEFLILLASPEAAASDWVKEELDIWCSTLERTESLIIVLTAGKISTDPETKLINWDASDTDALPFQLRHHLRKVPLYVDMTWATAEESFDLSNAEFKVAINAVVARLRGCDPNDMLGIEVIQHRRNIRLRNIAITLLITLTCLSVWGGISAWQANEETQKTLAETQLAVGREAIERDRDISSGILWYGEAMQASGWAASPARATARSLLSGRMTELPLHTFLHDDSVYRISFRPDGKVVGTVCQDGTARLWSTRSGDPIGSVLKHSKSDKRESLELVCFSNDNRFVATAGRDGAVRMWSARSGKAHLHALQCEDSVHDITFSPDSSTIAAASSDGTSYIWSTDTGELHCEPLAHDGAAVYALAFSPNGRTLATASNDNMVRVWDADSGRLSYDGLQHEGNVYSLGFSPDGSILACGSDESARLWNVESSELLKLYEHDYRVDKVAFSPNGKVFVSASGQSNGLVQKGQLRIWNAQNLQPLDSPGEFDRQVKDVAFSPDSRLIAAALTGAVRGQPGDAIIWNLSEGRLVDEPIQHSESIYSLRFSPDGNFLATAGRDNQAKLWKIPYRNRSSTLQYEALSGHVRMSSGGEVIATRSGNTVQVYDSVTGSELASYEHTAEVNAISLSPSGDWVVSCSGAESPESIGDVVVRDIESGQSVFAKSFRVPVEAVAIHKETRRLAVAMKNGVVRVLQLPDGSVIGTPFQHEEQIRELVFRPDGFAIASVGVNPTAELWDLTVSDPQAVFLKHDTIVYAIDFSPDNALVATGSWDRTCRIWDARTGRLLRSLTHENRVNSVKFSATGRTLVTGCWNNTACLWDLDSGQLITRPFVHKRPVEAAALSHDGKSVVTATISSCSRWDSPVPLRKPNNTIWLSLEVITGQTIKSGMVVPLNQLQWFDRKRQLNANRPAE